MSAEQTIANFIKWCKGRYGLDDETGEMYEPEYGENVELDLVIKEFMSEQISETTTNDRYAFIFYFEDGGWNFLTFDKKKGLDKYYSSDEDVSGTNGYWYGSYDGAALKRDVGKFVDNAEIVWEVDSIHSGWNMVANPYGWVVKL